MSHQRKKNVQIKYKGLHRIDFVVTGIYEQMETVNVNHLAPDIIRAP